MKVKIFCDIADLGLIRKFNKKKIVKGFTTNPSLMRKAGAKNYETYSKQLIKVCAKKPISLSTLIIFFLLFFTFSINIFCFLMSVK